MNLKTEHVFVRMTPQEKDRIVRLAGQCGLSISEYVRQRAAGYAPSAVSIDAVHALREPLAALLNRTDLPPESEREIDALLTDIREALVLPRRER